MALVRHLTQQRGGRVLVAVAPVLPRSHAEVSGRHPVPGSDAAAPREGPGSGSGSAEKTSSGGGGSTGGGGKHSQPRRPERMRAGRSSGQEEADLSLLSGIGTAARVVQLQQAMQVRDCDQSQL